MKNFILISPHFPDIYYKFAKELKNVGFNVLGIGNAPYHELSKDTIENLREYYYCPNMEKYEDVYRAVAFFAFKYGKISYLESNNEYWLTLDAKLREDFNIEGLKPSDMESIKPKSAMKEKYKEAGVNFAPYVVFTKKEELLPFVKEHGYPVFVKPNIGVGATDSFKIGSDLELDAFFAKFTGQIPYICEPFVTGTIVSFDALVDKNGEVAFVTSHEFPVPNDLISQGLVDDYYYSIPVTPLLDKLGRATVKAFGIKKRFVHLEFFKQMKDGEPNYFGLEVNMRPAGAYTPEMINVGSNLNIYKHYAEIMADLPLTIDPNRQTYTCIEVSRRKEILGLYELTNDEIIKKYHDVLTHHGMYPEILAQGMGDYFFIARFNNLTDALHFKDDVLKMKVIQ